MIAEGWFQSSRVCRVDKVYYMPIPSMLNSWFYNFIRKKLAITVKLYFKNQAQVRIRFARLHLKSKKRNDTSFKNHGYKPVPVACSFL